MRDPNNRPLTDTEHQLARWMLENGKTEAIEFLKQLDIAEVTPWKCPCGCASICFQIKGHALPSPSVHVLGDYLQGSDEEVSGIFIYSSDGLLSGIEVYGLAANAPQSLPHPDDLRPF